jgi:hypothetical protein
MPVGTLRYLKKIYKNGGPFWIIPLYYQESLIRLSPKPKSRKICFWISRLAHYFYWIPDFLEQITSCEITDVYLITPSRQCFLNDNIGGWLGIIFSDPHVVFTAVAPPPLPPSRHYSLSLWESYYTEWPLVGPWIWNSSAHRYIGSRSCGVQYSINRHFAILSWIRIHADGPSQSRLNTDQYLDQDTIIVFSIY